MSDKKITFSSNPSGRITKKDLYEKVKTAKFRKTSSTLWLQRQLNDPYVQAAKEEGYRSRAAYKLLQIQEKYKLLHQGDFVIDLGCAPGGWTQVLVQICGFNRVVGLDILPTDPIAGAHIIQADCLAEETWDLLKIAKGDNKVKMVLSDMAAPTIGHPQTDQLRTLALAEMAYEFSLDHLCEGGHFISKIFQGGAGGDLLTNLKQKFHKVHHVKPDASRKGSPEAYIVAQGFKKQY